MMYCHTSGAACLQTAGREQREPMGRRAVTASGRGGNIPGREKESGRSRGLFCILLPALNMAA
ncbi:hypothetical protein E5357_01595 [Hominisplanchenecus murintestinalis]|uniref:Uncharacterized protein n=1 Tax=Hominisplanchenecus murintestinalis TaxID=2941517 RepID=A0AC61R432_9FIRM|nr:hypothetical protein [Lachnospiraceae bacterium]NBI76790.1 hypothetical protein [Lachnospiraceae bacterium]RKJ82099.1 hypothetical protein D7Y41_24410 [Anaerotruncus sp. 1XD22-93]TGY00886.1 hypothetical protein E5357_01595 [Hominisplanchenecus murintestinalis]